MSVSENSVPESSKSRIISSDMRAQIFTILTHARRPMTAYQIIAMINKQSNKQVAVAPPTVYRGLSMLMDQGKVHKLQSMKAFWACGDSHNANDTLIIFLCDRCGIANEVCGEEVADFISRKASGKDFTPQNMTIEVHGLCKECHTK